VFEAQLALGRHAEIVPALGALAIQSTSSSPAVVGEISCWDAWNRALVRSPPALVH
jgi:hypothetical protein